jgi:regulator of sirC expression with transglutaminase-like and TPR domain
MMNRDSLLGMAEPWLWLADARDDEIPLDEAALLISRDEYPSLDATAYLERLRELAQELRERMHGAVLSDEPLRRIVALNNYLFDDLGFTGEALDYYDPRNSYLSDVLDRRRGIPISLSLLYVHLARSVDLPAEGISFPGHFLVRLPVDDGLIVLDPYHRGRSLGTEELRQRAWSAQAGDRPDDETLIDLLEPSDNRGILARMLRNLKSIYVDREDWDRALRVSDRLVSLQANAENFRDRGLLYRAVGAEGAALRDLRRYLELMPAAGEDEATRGLLTELARRPERLN